VSGHFYFTAKQNQQGRPSDKTYEARTSAYHLFFLLGVTVATTHESFLNPHLFHVNFYHIADIKWLALKPDLD